jgi:trans-aconitate methyltransferase
MSDYIMPRENFDELYFSKTDEKQILAYELRKIFNDRVYGQVLDVGPGPGEITQLINSHAIHLTLVEPETDYHDGLKDHFPKAKIIPRRYEAHDLDNCYDLIFISHALYFISKDRWLPTCKKSFDALNKGGQLIIVLNDHEKTELGKLMKRYSCLEEHCRWNYIPLDEFEEQLRRFGSVTSTTYSYTVVLNDRNEFTDAVLRVVLDLDSEELIEEYKPDVEEVAEDFKREDGRYAISAEARIIVVSAYPPPILKAIGQLAT